jgi:D-alanyl-D-alanine carboxypeptidase
MYVYAKEMHGRVTLLENQSLAQDAALAALEQALADSSESLASADATIRGSIDVINENLTLAQNNFKSIESALTEEQQKLAHLQWSTMQIEGSLGNLEKLSETDPELLQQYSKVFFLNEHYVPAELAEIKNEYLYSEKETQYIHAKILNKLTSMLDAAEAAGYPVYVKSAYRSFNEQDSLKRIYDVTYGVGTANQFSADQGYSEHQLGTTVDLITTGLNGQLEGFGDTDAFTWLQDHAHAYGFTLSYPEGNSSYIYEPWHWRFVGVELASRLHNEGKYFYELDQRTLDEYLVRLWD